jgi:hypothetical protein
MRILLLLILFASTLVAQNQAFLKFDGSNDYVKYFDDATLDKMDGAADYTIEAWVYPIDGTVAEYDRVLQRYNSFAIVLWDQDNNGKVEDWYFQVYDKANSSWKYFNTESDSTLKLDEWNHIAVINNSADSSLKLFVNGKNVTESGKYANMSLLVPDGADTLDNLYIGQKGNGHSFLGGYLDEIRLKNVAVDSTDLHCNITDDEYTSDANTAGLFHFDEGTGDSTMNSASGLKARLGDDGAGDSGQPAWETTVTGLPLPVELISFTATKKGEVTLLTWETATEVNIYGFEIESSNNNMNWTKIGFVEGHGNSNSLQSYSFIATDGAKYYRLKQLDVNGEFNFSKIVKVVAKLTYKLAQNYPNPFNPATQISFTLPEAAKVSISVYNALGEKVAELTNKEYSAGVHSVNFNASELTSGIYFYRLNSPNYSATKKMLLVK